MSTTHVTETQRQILKQFEQLQRDLYYQPININASQALQHTPSLVSQQSNKSIQSQGSNPDIPTNKPPQPAPTLQILLPTPQQSTHPLLTKLQSYKSTSTLIHTLSTLLHTYSTSFHHLQQQRCQLLQLLTQIHSSTSALIDKQKKYIDLANGLKEALDYYLMLDGFEFGWMCQLSTREMFEDQLQAVLSGLTDGVEFFGVNGNYANSRKYYNGLVSARTKVTSFTKSFFIKLFNKQYGFSIKNTKNQLHRSITTFYPKSKPKFLSQFITFFPQFQKQLKLILMTAKETSNQAESNLLLRKQAEIQQFILNDSSISLILYLQKNIPQVYEQVILKFISYYRTNFHQNYHKTLLEPSPPPSPAPQPAPQPKFQDTFRELLTQSIFILTSEAAYLEYCMRAQTELAREYAKGTLSKIADYYTNMIVRFAKEPGKGKDPFRICNQVSYAMDQCWGFLGNYGSGRYEGYALGAVIRYVEGFGMDILKSILQKLATKIKTQMQPVCQNMLPKYKPTTSQSTLTTHITNFITTIPNLQYCPTQAQKYLISTLDSLIKSIKQVSNHIQSRLECYAWNLEIFALIEANLERVPVGCSLVKREVRVDVGDSLRMIERVRGVGRRENWVRYAVDLFSVIRTGVPTLSELTLDFHTFIRQYLSQLKQKFIKDMVFIHAKSIIQFLQQLKQSQQSPQPPQTPPQLCQKSQIKDLHTKYKLSIQNFISSANEILQTRQRQFAIYEHGEQLLIELLREVEENLLDLMGTFYVEVTKYMEETGEFENVREFRGRFEAGRGRRGGGKGLEGDSGKQKDKDKGKDKEKNQDKGAVKDKQIVA